MHINTTYFSKIRTFFCKIRALFFYFPKGQGRPPLLPLPRQLRSCELNIFIKTIKLIHHVHTSRYPFYYTRDSDFNLQGSFLKISSISKGESILILFVLHTIMRSHVVITFSKNQCATKTLFPNVIASFQTSIIESP